MDLSVVIPTAGKWDRLEFALSALRRQRVPAAVNWEIVLCTDGVEPPRRTALGHPRLRRVHRPNRGGRGAARNTGIAAARGDVIVLLDDDVVACSDLVAAHLEAQQREPSLCHGPTRELPVLVHVSELSPTRLRSGVSLRLQPRLLSLARRVVSALSNPLDCYSEFGVASRLEQDGVAALKSGNPMAAWVAFAGANLSGPRSLFITMPFDERPGIRWGLEDIALALHCVLHGHSLRLAERAFAVHLSHERRDWKADMASNRLCLDYLPAHVVNNILAYLNGYADVSNVESSLAAFKTDATISGGECEGRPHD